MHKWVLHVRLSAHHGLVGQLLLNNLLVDLVLSHLLGGDGVLGRRLTIVILKSLVTVHARHLLLIRVHHIRVMVALKHTLLERLLCELGSRHATWSKAWDSGLASAVEA